MAFPINFGKVVGKSVVKALKDTGKLAGLAAAVAGATVLADPTLIAPIWAAAGPYGPIAVLAVNFAGKAILDAIKHRNDGEGNAPRTVGGLASTAGPTNVGFPK